MSALNRPENFAGRVNYAAAVISNGRRTSRAFDNCFENLDGDAVIAALVRRSEKNPRLAANLWRYLCEDTATEIAERLKGKNLAEAAAKSRALITKNREARPSETPLNEAQRIAARTYGDGDYSHAAECASHEAMRTGLRRNADTLFSFVMIELATVEGCDSLAEAARRLQVAENDLLTVRHAIERAADAEAKA